MKKYSEKIMHVVFLLAACASILAVILICAFLFVNGIPTIGKIGLGNFVLGKIWMPKSGIFGIFPMIIGSIYVTAGAILVGVPVGILAAIYMAKFCNEKVYKIVKPAVDLLAGIPSVVYGLLGILIVNPMMYKLELMIYHGSKTHQFTGGANLLSAIIVLAIMILPTLINISETALKAVPDDYRKSSLALGASKIQTIFKVVVPSAKSGIMSAIVLGVGRAIGEAMAILLVAGNAVSLPLPFNSVRFLTTAIVSEMGYASGTHRQVLFTIGLVLFIFIMIINLILTYVLKRGDLDE